MRQISSMVVLCLLCSVQPYCLALAQEQAAPSAVTGDATVNEVKPAPVAETTQAVPATPAVAAAPEAAAVPAANKDGLAFGGLVFLALQNWSKVGMTGDAKLGIGVGGTFGLGYRIDNMKLVVGPSIASNTWSADYSTKSQSATGRVYVTLNDAGISLLSYFDDMYIELGTGTATLKTGYFVNGTEYSYPYHGKTCNYKSVGIGFKSESLVMGLGIKNYDSFGNDADHVNFFVGLGF